MTKTTILHSGSPSATYHVSQEHQKQLQQLNIPDNLKNFLVLLHTATFSPITMPPPKGKSLTQDTYKKLTPSRASTDSKAATSDSDAQYSEILAEIKLFRADIQAQLLSMTEQYNSRIDSLERKLLERDNEITHLKATIQLLQEQTCHHAQQSLANEIEIIGLPEKDNENLQHLVMIAANKIGVKLGEMEIDWVARAGPRITKVKGKDPTEKSNHNDLPRPVVVKLVRRSTRELLLKAAKTRKDLTTADIIAGTSKAIYINERLTKQTRLLFREARMRAKQYKYKFCWTSNGTILIRQEDKKPSIKIQSEDDLVRHLGPPLHPTPDVCDP